MSNKLAVVTGAASGIGLALAKTCLLEGMNVVMADVAEAELYHQIDQLNQSRHSEVMGIICDVTNQEQVNQLAKQCVERFGNVDLLINNAGIMGPLAPIWEVGTEHIQHVFDTNLYGVINCAQAFLPFMFAQHHRSQMVNMASLYGLCSGSLMATYAMSKHALIALSESLYFDLKRLKKPVDISVVCPSFTNTQLLVNSPSPNDSGICTIVNDYMEHCRSADDVAACIMREIKNRAFYILPDHEVKDYCEQRTKAIIEQRMPHEHSLEKILASLSMRV